MIPNAVDIALFEVAARARRATTGPFRIGFIGRLDPVKRVTDLVESMAERTRGEARLDLYGDGPDRPNIEAAIRRFALADAVTIHGFVRRAPEALADMDVLVLPSDAEGFGLVLIEAMAAGVPVVGTRVAGICDVIRDGVTGLLSPVRRPLELRATIDRVRLDGALAQRLVLAAASEVRERYAWPAVLAQYRRLLQIDG